VAEFWTLGGIHTFMRPHFIVYLAAGIVLFFAVLSIVTHVCEANTIQHVIQTLQPVGDDLARLQAARSDHYDSAAASFMLAGLQGLIIVCTRKLKRQAMPANKSLQATAAALASCD
jgi:hypothetical protein